VTNVNEAPVITSNGAGATAAVSVAENSTAVTTLTATDPDAGSTVSFSIVGGADASKFTINATTGALSFVTAPNFEVPTDAGLKNVYDVIVRASDSILFDDQALAVAVTDVNEAPVITSNGAGATAAVSVAENTTAVATVTATDPDAGTTLSFSIVGGADAGKFLINSVTGAITFAAAPDFEAPTDVGANNVYDVIVQVSDGHGFIDTQAIAVTVTNVLGVNLTGTNAADVLTGTSEPDTLTGLGGNDILNGLGGNDILNGGAGNDTLDGGAGNDTMIGGLGNDIFIVDSLGDVVTENASEGTDVIRTTLNTFSLAALPNVEDLTFIGIGDFIGTGNAAANTITGGSGNDILDGGAGVDRLVGGLGNDTYLVDNVADVVVEGAGGGIDTVLATSASYTLSANVENLTFTGVGNFTGTGSADNNTITGGAGANTLSGAGGDDTIFGGIGNDTLNGDAGNDVLNGDAGNDILNGGAGIDTIHGGTGADTLIGGAGSDSLFGDAGNDIFGYTIGDGADVVDGGADLDTLNISGTAANNTLNVIFNGTAITPFEGGTIANVESFVADLLGGTDTLNFAGSLAGVAVNLATGTASGFTSIAGVENVNGTDFNDTLTGDALANLLDGGAGNDILVGGAGADTLNGSAGDDRLTGGAGNDALNGGAGNDILIFAAGFGNDTVTGFDSNPVGGQDLIDITAYHFTAANFAANVLIAGVGTETLITIGADQIHLLNVTTNTVNQTDFIL
jgi:Ca2+-binding RTX toxin-like protein